MLLMRACGLNAALANRFKAEVWSKNFNSTFSRFLATLEKAC